MSDATTRNTWQFEADQEVALGEYLTAIQNLNAQIQADQADIDRLKAETRAIADHSDRLLLQIEAQLDLLRKVA